jgi:hypothetical protein
VSFGCAKHSRDQLIPRGAVHFHGWSISQSRLGISGGFAPF